LKINGRFEECVFTGELLADDIRNVPKAVEEGKNANRVGYIRNKSRKSTLIASFKAKEKTSSGMFRLHIDSLQGMDRTEHKVRGLEMRVDTHPVTCDAMGGVVVVPPGEWHPILEYATGENRMLRERVRLPNPAKGFSRPMSFFLSWAPAFLGNGPRRAYYSSVDTFWRFTHADSFELEEADMIGIWTSAQPTGPFSKSASITIEPVEPRSCGVCFSLFIVVIYPIWLALAIGFGFFYLIYMLCTLMDRCRWKNGGPAGKEYRRYEHVSGLSWDGQRVSEKYPDQDQDLSHELRVLRNMQPDAYTKRISKHKVNQKGDPRARFSGGATARTWAPQTPRTPRTAGGSPRGLTQDFVAPRSM